MDLSDVTIRCGSNDTIMSTIVDESVFCTDFQSYIVDYGLPAIIALLIILIVMVIVLLNKKRVLIW